MSQVDQAESGRAGRQGKLSPSPNSLGEILEVLTALHGLSDTYVHAGFQFLQPLSFTKNFFLVLHTMPSLRPAQVKEKYGFSAHKFKSEPDGTAMATTSYCAEQRSSTLWTGHRKGGSI